MSEVEIPAPTARRDRMIARWWDQLIYPHLLASERRSEGIGQDAAALGDAAQCEHHRIDLVRIGIDAPARPDSDRPPAPGACP